MDATRARVLVVAVLSVGLVTPLQVSSAIAATCTLAAPSTVAVGTPLVIAGSGFPASSSVDISLTLEGGSPDHFAVQSDGNGTFQVSLTPEMADIGVTTVVATAGGVCTAQVTFTVSVSSSTAAPQPTKERAGSGSASTPPRTDADGGHGGPVSRPPVNTWLAAVLLLFLGLGGLIATRPSRTG